MNPAEYRAQFDATVTFANGGGLTADGFRVDVPGPDVSDEEVAALFIASLSLLMVDRVELRNRTVFAEPHKGTRAGPSDHSARPAPGGQRIIDLSEFQIDEITMVGNTGTYLDSPYHRYPDGTDLAGLPLESCVELPAVVARTLGSLARAVDTGALAALDVTGRAVLLHTGGDAAWGRADYAADAPYLTAAGARWLADHGARLVGIDSVNIDDIQGDGSRPAHSILLEAGIPVVEHLTGLGQLPPTGFLFTAAPVPLADFGTFPVRAYASVPEREVPLR
jgi:arylformamidase